MIDAFFKHTRMAREDFKEIFSVENNDIIDNLDGEEFAGVWALYGKENDERWLCLQVGQTKYVKKEIRADIELMESELILKRKKNYVNQFGEYLFEYEETPSVREVLYHHIKKKYKDFVFVCVGRIENERERKKIESSYAREHHAVFWRNGRPYKSGLQVKQSVLVDWIVNRVKNEYAQDISLVLTYGSYVNGTAGPKSDVDCYFIPKTQRGYEFATTFILDGIGYDIFPMSWERVTQIANLQQVLLPCVGDVKVLYAASTEDLKGFEELQGLMKKNLQDETYSKQIAVEKVKQASNMLEGNIRVSTGYIISTLADAAAIYHHTYYHRGLKKQYEDLLGMTQVPGEVAEEYLAVIRSKTDEECIEHCNRMLQAVAAHIGVEAELGDHKDLPAQVWNYQELGPLYEEIRSTFNKIYANDDPVVVYHAAVSLQGELPEDLDIIGAYCYDDLSSVKERAKQVEQIYVDRIERAGGRIKRYKTMEEVMNAYDHRRTY